MSLYVWLAIIAVVMIVLIVRMLVIKKRKIKANNLFEDQLVVDKFDTADLISWFKEKNPEKKHASMVIMMNEENIKKYHLDRYVKPLSEKCLVQCVYDAEKDGIVCGRVIVYNSLEDKIASIINSSNGAVIFD